MQRSTKNHWHVSFAASIGSALEYYAFITFILLVGPLTHVFFPNDDPQTGVLKVLAIFTVAYICTPLGCLLFGTISDRIGRKTVFIMTLWLMAITATIMGLLPGYATAGLFGSILLVLCRFVQGLVQGAEMVGSLVLVAEHTNGRNRGFHCSLISIGITFGASLATLMNYLLHQLLTEQQIIHWGWRIPFLLSIVLGFIGYWARRRVDEPHIFLLETQRHKFAFWALLRTQPIAILQGMGLVALGAGLVTFGLLLPHFLLTQFGYPYHLSFLVMSITFIAILPVIPILGWLSDRLGRAKMLAGVAIAVIILLPLGIWMLATFHHVVSLFIFIVGYYILLNGLAANYLPMLTELFPTQYRFTGVGAAYTYCYSLVGFVPLIATWLVHRYHSAYAAVCVLGLLGLITLAVSLTIKTNK